MRIKKFRIPHFGLIRNPQPAIRQSGFSLLEALVATAVFAFVLASIFGVYNSALQLDRKSKSQRAIAQNARFIMEYIGKEIRNGSIYYAGYPGGIATSTLALVNQSNEIEYFSLSGSNLQLEKNSATTNLNSADVRVTQLQFYIEPDGDPYVLGSAYNQQPYVTVAMQLTSNYGNQAAALAALNLQSTFATRSYPSRVVGGAAPGLCGDPAATNFGGALPCTYPPPDTTNPIVAITAPTAGGFVGGASVTVSATASDDIGVVGVQFKLDGVNIGTEDLTAPYSITWNSNSVANGSHTFTAVARDAANNSTTSTGVAATVDNTSPVVSAFDVQPRTTGSSVTATFTATDAGGSHLKNAELWRADYNAANCTVSVVTGCTWSVVDTETGNNLDSWSGTASDTPATGVYIYGVHVYDNSNNFGLEPTRIEVTATSSYFVYDTTGTLGTNLTSYWKMDEGSGNRADSVGSNTLSNVNGPLGATGKQNTAASFISTSSQKLTIADNTNLSTGNISFSVGAWVYFNSLISAVDPIVLKWEGNTPSNREYALYRNSSNQFEFVVNNSSDSLDTITASTPAVATGNWYFVVGWYDATADTLNIQVNNGTVFSKSNSTGSKDSTASFTIGGYSDGIAYYHNGGIDEVGFWKKALSAQERTDLYYSGYGNTYLNPRDTTAPSVSAFNVTPNPTLGAIRATFSATDSGNAHFRNAELWRAAYNASNCTVSVVTGCTWSTVATTNAATNMAFTSVVGLSVSTNNLTKSGADGWNTAGASSTQTISAGDGYVEFSTNENTTYKMGGLSVGDTDQNYPDIDFAIYPNAIGQLHVYESGIHRGQIGTYVAGDIFRVAVVAGVVKYYQNGTLLYSSTVAPSYPLRFDSAFFSSGATMTNMIVSSSASDAWSGTLTDVPPQGASYIYGTHVYDMAGNTGLEPARVKVDAGDFSDPIITTFDVQPRTTSGAVKATFTATDAGGSHLKNAELWRANYNPGNCNINVVTGCTWSTVASTNAATNVTFTSAVGVTLSSNNLSKPGSDSWNAGAISTQTITAGDGYVEFSTNENTTYKMGGLGFGDTDQNYPDIEYAIYPNAIGHLHVYESGAHRGQVGTYVAGDVFRVAVVSGVVKYYKNGTLLYNSAVAPVYPLRFDSAFFSSGATMTNIIISSAISDSWSGTMYDTPPAGSTYIYGMKVYDNDIPTPNVGIEPARIQVNTSGSSGASSSDVITLARSMNDQAGSVSSSPTNGGPLTLNGVLLGDHDYTIKNGNQTVSSFNNSDWFTTTQDTASAWVTVNGNLTINAGQTFTPAHRKLFTVIYVKGDLTVNGSISMTARGASHSGTPPGNIKIISGTYSGVTDPQIPSGGGAGGSKNTNGAAGSSGGTGGGGGGGAAAAGITNGSAGTSFSGGSGGGGDWSNAGSGGLASAAANGGAGGNGYSGDGWYANGGGAGNPGGSGYAATGFANSGSSGTGGTLIIIVEGVFSGSGTVTANGSPGGTANSSGFGSAGGGASGGGSVNILTAVNIGPVPSAVGGAGGSAEGAIGGNGGNGTARVLLLPYTIEYLVVGGGGGGGAGGSAGGGDSGGGGGAGGVLIGSTIVNDDGAGIAVTVGPGGGAGSNGTDSSIAGIATAIGGGRGGAWGSAGNNGGSGGGGGGGPGPFPGGFGTSGQGSDGGAGSPGTYRGGGGGGRTSNGVVGSSDGGNGGAGIANSYSGSSVVYGGGGGGGGGNNGGSGGSGGGGRGANSNVGNPINAAAGVANTGGGGGGGANRGGSLISPAAGGSGIIIIRYLGPQRATGGVVTTSGGYTIHTYNSNGTFNP